MIFDKDQGFVLELDCRKDVSSGTAYHVAVENVTTGAKTELLAALSGSDNTKIQRLVADGDFPNPGKYKIQAKVTFGAAGPLYGEIKEVQVREAISP